MASALRSLGLCLLLGLLAKPGFAQSALRNTADPSPQANPGRPTVSNPATLTPVGYVQLETGVLGATHSPEFSSSTGLNETVRLSVTSHVELITSFQPMSAYNSVETAGTSLGDESVGAQVLLHSGSGAKPAISVACIHRLYDGAAPDLDVGSTANSFQLLVSDDLRGFHVDVNAFFNDADDGPIRRLQFGQSLAASHRLTGKLTLAGEIWRFTQPFLNGDAVGTLWAATYPYRPALVFDAGVNRGLTSTSTEWEFFTGVTYLLPHRLWGKSS